MFTIYFFFKFLNQEMISSLYRIKHLNIKTIAKSYFLLIVDFNHIVLHDMIAA